MNYANIFNPSQGTPQTERADAAQVANSAGGFSFAVDSWKRLERFLILGAEGGSYYAGERQLVRENGKAIMECLNADPERTVRVIAEISEAGRAPKNDAAIFALALAASHTSPAARKAAYAALWRVCRIGTHLFQFVSMVDSMRGWGPGLRKAVANWYVNRSPEDVAFQFAKYTQRDGWSHKDVLSLCHASKPELDAVFRYITRGPNGGGDRVIQNKRTGQCRDYADPGALPAFLEDLEALKHADVAQTIALIERHGYTHEMIRTEHKNSVAVWEALLPRMGLTALIRNLGKLTEVGLLGGRGSKASQFVAEKLQNQQALRKARVHPYTMLVALMTYKQGHGDKGSLQWSPLTQIVDALDAGFYESFGAIEPSGKRHLLALDISGSMTWHPIAGGPASITPRVAAACMAMVTARVEKDYEIVGFCGDLQTLDISPRRRLDDIVTYMDGLRCGRTDCSLPMLTALQNKWGVDMFTVYTDNETFAGLMHPHEALRKYRQATGIPARSAVVGMISNGFTIADPNDAGMVDVVGFDAAAPAFLSGFAKGEF